ncbi:hypothetical protein PM082_012416 [Marasmius tenuissimus]|nr:hypothetical protein PM082_012416 [Marasmius tenuissimus]
MYSDQLDTPFSSRETPTSSSSLVFSHETETEEGFGSKEDPGHIQCPYSTHVWTVTLDSQTSTALIGVQIDISSASTRQA